MKFIFVMVLGLIIFMGLSGADKRKCIIFILFSGLGVLLIFSIHFILGTNLTELLLLEIASRSSTGLFILYSALIGGMLRLFVNDTNKKSMESTKSMGSDSIDF